MNMIKVAIVLILLPNYLVAMQADVLPKAEHVSSEEEQELSERLQTAIDNLFEGDPSREVLFRRRLDLEALNIFDHETQKSVLYCAVLDGDRAKVKALLAGENARSLVNETTENGWTPLHVAAGLDNCPLIEDLLAAGALANPPGDEGFTPLHWAAGLKHDGRAVTLLLKGGALVSAKRESDGSTPLHLAQTEGAAQALLDGGAELEARDNKRQTPLYTAIYDQMIGTIKVLCDRGASLFAADNDGVLALGAGPLISYRTPEFRELLFKYWVPQDKKEIDSRVRKMFGFI